MLWVFPQFMRLTCTARRRFSAIAFELATPLMLEFS